MTTKIVTACDFKRDGEPCGRPSRKSSEACTGVRHFAMDVCEECLPLLEAQLANLGFHGKSKVANSKMRRTYIAKSGRVFDTPEARDWLATNGYNVPSGGRLSEEMLSAFADAH